MFKVLHTQPAIIINVKYSDSWNQTRRSTITKGMLLERICELINEMGEDNGILVHGSKINNLKFTDDVDLLATNNKGLHKSWTRYSKVWDAHQQGQTSIGQNQDNGLWEND